MCGDGSADIVLTCYRTQAHLMAHFMVRFITTTERTVSPVFILNGDSVTWFIISWAWINQNMYELKDGYGDIPTMNIPKQSYSNNLFMSS